MWPFTQPKETLRKKACAQAQEDVMREFLGQPTADKKQDWRELEIVSLDLETTGLDPKTDQILSIGLVELKKGNIYLDTAWHKIINVGAAVPETTAVIHHITDDIVAQGEPLESVLPELLKRLTGKVMLVHYSFIEQQFINAACQKLYGSPFIIQTIDTLPIAQRRMERRNHTIQAGNLRLFNLMTYYNLPHYKAHNALYDAISTAELFQAMTMEISPHGKQRLGDYLN